jgi:anti-anti-sigma factor
MSDEQRETDAAPRPGESTRFELEASSHAGELVLRLSGELDGAFSAQLEAGVRQAWDARPDTLVLDLSALAFIDSSGLRVILSTWDRCQGDGVELVLVPGLPQVQRLFEIVGLLDKLPFRAGTAAP